jgi:ABC-type transport system involved in multi-copper enzyme maturation permease subunit
LRSREVRLLLRKDLAELFASRAFWILLLAVGLLVGQSFITAVDAYAEASGIGGGAAALAQGLSPLDGILSPTAGAYQLAITLLFPFVAIRLVASEKSTGALKLLLQWPVRMRHHLGAKLLALLVAWAIALIPFGGALLLWHCYGGHLDAGETLNLVAGHTLLFILTSGLAVAAASMMPGAANAAVVVLGFTIGTWALDFIATGRGGLLQRLASFTPTATLRTFERGLFRADVATIVLLLALFAFVLAGIALDLGQSVRGRLVRGAVATVTAAALIVLAAQWSASADFSENRRSSFAAADARVLARIREPLTITVFLAAEDPRMADFESNVLVKLRRAVPRLDVRYPLAGRSGLFDDDERYGEIHYTLGAKSVVSRSTTEEIVLETIDNLAGLRAPAPTPSTYPGYPLAKRPTGAGVVFYLVWPLATLLAWLIARRAPRSRRTG